MTSELIIQHSKENALPGRALTGVGFLLNPDAGSPAARELETQKHEDSTYVASSLINIFENQRLNKDGWQRSLAATIALLKQAHVMIESAEEKIAAQDQRIHELESMATTDELTGVKNRRGFYENFIRELDRCDRGISDGGLLILIDLDNFKAINDTFGHAAGDACLRLVAKTLANEIRLMDTAARLGGDEFVLLFANTSKKIAAARAQSIGQRLNNLSLAWEGDVIPVRASLGLKDFRKGDRIETIFNAADAELYSCKKTRHKECA